MWVFLNKVFYREGLLAPRPTSKLEDNPSSAVRDCLFNLFAAALLIGGRSSILKKRTRHAVVQCTELDLILSATCCTYINNCPTRCNKSSLFIILQVHYTCLGCQIHPSSGVHKNVTTASGTGAATSPQRGQAWPRWRESSCIVGQLLI